eukprot:4094300-Alexandrium_andersonii.AAC.1
MAPKKEQDSGTAPRRGCSTHPAELASCSPHPAAGSRICDFRCAIQQPRMTCSRAWEPGHERRL